VVRVGQRLGEGEGPLVHGERAAEEPPGDLVGAGGRLYLRAHRARALDVVGRKLRDPAVEVAEYGAVNRQHKVCIEVAHGRQRFRVAGERMGLSGQIPTFGVMPSTTWSAAYRIRRPSSCGTGWWSAWPGAWTTRADPPPIGTLSPARGGRLSSGNRSPPLIAPAALSTISGGIPCRTSSPTKDPAPGEPQSLRANGSSTPIMETGAAETACGHRAPPRGRGESA